MLECRVTVTHHKAFSCSHYMNVRKQLPLSRRNSFHFHFGSTWWDFFFSVALPRDHCIASAGTLMVRRLVNALLVDVI